MNLGDYKNNTTIDFKFTTRTLGGIASTLDGTPVVSVYKGNSTSKTVIGVTLMPDFDTIVGSNHVRIVLTDAFYAVGNDYQITITAGTVNGLSVVGEQVRDFSIENRSQLLANRHVLVDTTIATLTSQTSFTLTSGSSDDGAYEGGVAIIQKSTTPAQKTFMLISSYVGATKTITLAKNPGIFTMGVNDIITIVTNASVPGVWDRILTGTTHNISTSAGKRVRQIQIGAYEHGSVWIDTVNGEAGDTDDENGTVNNPVNNLTDATTIAISKGLQRFKIAPSSSILLEQTYNNFLFDGHGWTLALGNEDVSGCIFVGADISGISLGTEAHYYDCVFNSVTLALTHAHKCALNGPITVGSAGEYSFIESYSKIAGIVAPIFDYNVAISNTNVNFRNYSGGLDVRNMGQNGVDNMSLEGRGQLIVNANCIGVGNVIAIRGIFKLTNNGEVTISDEARLDTNQINKEVDNALDTAIPGSPTANSINDKIANLPPVIKKNTSLSNFIFFMRDSTDNVSGKTGLTISSRRSLDGGSFGATTNTATEISDGFYKINLSAADLNADTIGFDFASTGALSTVYTFITQK